MVTSLSTADRAEDPGEDTTAARVCRLTLDEWQQFVTACPTAHPFHHRKWMELLIEQYGFRPLIVALRAGEEIRAALPFLESKRPWGTRRLVSLPFTDCLTPLVGSAKDFLLLTNHLRTDLADRYQRITLRSSESLPGTETECHWVRHQIELPASVDELLPRYASVVRRNLRKAERSELEFETSSDPAAVRAFYGLHLRTRRRMGIPVQPRGFFDRLGSRILAAGLGHVAMVRREKKVVAAAVLMTYNGTVVYKYAASNPDMLEYRPNEYLIHHALRDAVAAGYDRFDFGVTQKDQDGLKRFKAKWGAVETPVFDCSVVGDMSGPAGESRAVRLASAVIRRSPLFVCRGVGELLYRFVH